MKRMKKMMFLWFIAIVCILASCTKDGGIDPVSYSSDNLLKGKPVQGPLVVIPPSGGDDTDALLDAVNSAAAGTTIQLTEGEYHTRYFEIHGFNGVIKGAGRNKTFIMPYELIEVMPQINDWNKMPSWWRILGGNVTISDLAFRTGDGTLLADDDPFYNDALVSLITVNNFSLNYQYYDPQPMTFNFINVDVLGGYLGPDEVGYAGLPHNVVMAVWFGMDIWVPAEPIPLSSITCNMSGCFFEDVGQGFEALGCGDNSTLVFDRNRVDNAAWGAFFTGNYGSRIWITNNTFSGSMIYDLLISDWEWGLLGAIPIPAKRSEYYVTGNTFNVSNVISSFILKDERGVAVPDFYYPTLAMVKNNLFNLCEGSTGISCLNSRDAQVRNNKLAGSAAYGVYVDGVVVYDIWTGSELGIGESKNALILGNNFSSLTTSGSDIYLSALSSNCTVVGNGKDDVIDLGTDNKIVGMNKMSGGNHAGPAIGDNFRMMPKMRGH